MTETPALDPIEKTVTVPLSPDRAFKLFTEELADWWPAKTHSLSAADNVLPRDITVEPRVGGQVLETLPDGHREPWGTVTEWAPGHGFAMTWHVGRPEEEATHVAVRFLPDNAGCRVALTHSGWTAATAATHAGYNTGWSMVLGQVFASAARALLSKV